MWAEAEQLCNAHRATLASHGVELRARLEPDHGLMCTYSGGVIRLALPDPALPGGELRVQLLASLLDLPPATVVWLFRAQLTRLVGHEIGHALRDEYRTDTGDPWIEEQAAERFANALGRVDRETRRRLVEVLAPVVDRLGGLAEAAALHRNRRALAIFPVTKLPPAAPPGRDRYRDLPTFLRLAVAWGYLDLLLDEEEDLDACCNALLAP